MARINLTRQQLPLLGAPAFIYIYAMDDYTILIKGVKSKRPLDRLDDEFVRRSVDKFISRNMKLKKKFPLGRLKKSEERQVTKAVRNELNRVYGQFWRDKNGLSLKGHRSISERIDFYNLVYKKISAVTGRVYKVLDLGCGLNPLTYKAIPGYKDIYFTAVELTDYDCKRLREYFYENSINGEVIKADLTEYGKFSFADVCFMFKLLDSMEVNGHRVAEHLVRNTEAKYIVASFSTLSVRGRRMNYPQRGWFERMIRRLGYKFTKFETVNEVFYIVKKF